jgi:hypothetical protein
MHRGDDVAEPVPAQAHPFAPVRRTFLLHVSFQLYQLVQRAQENYDGFGAHFPVADSPEAFGPYPARPANMPPAGNGLRNLVGHFLNNPGTLVNMLRIEPGPGGRFEVWIALELAEIYIF